MAFIFWVPYFLIASCKEICPLLAFYIIRATFDVLFFQNLIPNRGVVEEQHSPFIIFITLSVLDFITVNIIRRLLNGLLRSQSQFRCSISQNLHCMHYTCYWPCQCDVFVWCRDRAVTDNHLPSLAFANCFVKPDIN